MPKVRAYQCRLGLLNAIPKSTTSILNPEAALQTFDVYAAPALVFYEDGPRMDRKVKRERASLAVAATIMNAVTNPHYEFGFDDEIRKAMQFAQEERLIIRQQTRLLSRAAWLVRI